MALEELNKSINRKNNQQFRCNILKFKFLLFLYANYCTKWNINAVVGVRVPFRGSPQVELGKNHAVSKKKMNELHQDYRLNSKLCLKFQI